MKLLWIALVFLIMLSMLFLLISYICFRKAFYVSRCNGNSDENEIGIPEGDVYEPFREKIEKWSRDTQNMPYKEFSIISFDGTELFAKFYEYAPNAPIELMFHGYRGTAQRDLAGGVQRCFKLKRSAFIVDQRTSGKSGGSVITFGIKEHRDCLAWVDFMVKHFGDDVKILLCGISMGASTVLIAAGKQLPKNVFGVLADCGFSSAKDIIKKVIQQMGLPSDLGYFFVKLGAKIYGRFDLEETSAVEALKNCTLPVIFFHGEDDDYVPCEMSKINFDACASRKMLVTIKSAGHGLCYPVEPLRYLKELEDFFGTEASYCEK